MSDLVDVHLYGPLAERFGARHSFAVRSPREAVAALDANFPGFRSAFIQSEIYYVQADGDWRDGDDAAVMPVSREIHLVPQIEGRAFLAPIVGALLFPALVSTTILGISAATLLGGLVVTGLLIGVSLLLMPKQKKRERDDDKRNESYAFTGPENITEQGVPVPLIYGRVHCGSVVVSTGLEVNTILGGLGQSPTGDKYKGPENLQSKQLARVLDILSEGAVKGLVNGLQGVFLDGVPLQNEDGSLNFNSVAVQQVFGYLGTAQPVMSGFPSQEAETAVSVELKYNQPVVRTITNPDADRCRVTVSVPQLTMILEGQEDIRGSWVQYSINVRGGGGGGYTIGAWTISGKTTSRYQQQIVFELPKGQAPWDIVVTRVSLDVPPSGGNVIEDSIYFDSYTEIIDDRINYNLTAAVGLQFDAQNFQTIPQRTYLIDGMLLQVPTNYDPINGTYDGVWDGTFKFAWTNNPAFVFYDLVTQARYGIGKFMPAAWVDKWALYAIAQWCDQQVPNGRGGWERRYICNVQITSQSEAFDLLGQIASIFLGFAYWAGGKLIPVADMPADPAMQFANANVINGAFNYSGSDIRARHTMASVAWKDPTLLGQGRLAIVEDQEAISRYGIQQADVTAIGCTSESQAIRAGKWALYRENYEGEAISFSTGLEGAYLTPGDIIQVADVNIAGNRTGGRVASATTTQVWFDSPPAGSPGVITHYLSCIVGADSHVETRAVYFGGSYATVATDQGYAPFSAAPLPDSVFVVTFGDTLAPTLWRVTNVKQAEAGVYDVNGTRYRPDKWNYVEHGIALSEPDVSDIRYRPAAITNLQIREYMIATSLISVGVRVVLSWNGTAPSYDVWWRPQNGNWSHQRTDQQAIDLPVTEGLYEFMVQPVSGLGIRGPVSTLTYTVIGRFAPPLAPQQFRIKISDGVALFEWLPSKEIDVVIGGHFELRHSSRTDAANWASAQVVIPSIPGSATTVEAVYRTGTWFLRTFDIVGTQSVNVATILVLQQDGRYTEFVRICENPDFLGAHNYTEVRQPQQWLVIGQTGGLWDDQMAAMDTWSNVDVLAENAPNPPQAVDRHGWYLFEDRIDAGGVFTVRFSADILAFPYQEGSEFIDDRLNNIDEWADFDNVDADLGGQVQLFIRTTNNDPASNAAAWSPWQVFSPMEYTARGFEFRADLYAPAGQNIGVEELCIIADLRMKMDSGEDVPYPAKTTHVAFAVKFYLVPAVVITVQNALATDQIQITNKTRDGFDIDIKNAGAQVTRVFDWQARGY